MSRSHTRLNRWLIIGTWLSLALHAFALPAKLGDLDEDGVVTVLDIAKLTAHFDGTHPLSSQVAVFADMNQDGALNDGDQEEMVKEILGTRTPQDLPLCHIRLSSPSNGESDVALTRETIMHFTMPLSVGATVDTSRFYAEFGARRILSCVQLSSDRRKATLFYLEPLPANARIKVTFNGIGVYDLLGRLIDADNDSAAGGALTLSFDTLGVLPVENTGVMGRVLASERATGGAEVGLAGVTITVDGAEETLRCVTDSNGYFFLFPAPAGTFFVTIDGRTSPASHFPSGSYYPSVGKKWFTYAGKIDNPSGAYNDTPQGGGTGIIYLPCVCAGTLNAVSETLDTTVTLPPATVAANPSLAGIQLTVPANSLFSDNGARGGSVGIAPVAADRLPSPLPQGLNAPIVITVQTNGPTNFDRPVSVTFPNLPDPISSEKLEPGAKTALWSFNHDIGDWEVVGPMTVTEDGNFLTTDAGVGIRQPGWHIPSPTVTAYLRTPKQIAKCLNSTQRDVWQRAYSAVNTALPCFESLSGLGLASETIHLLTEAGKVRKSVLDHSVNFIKFQERLKKGEEITTCEAVQGILTETSAILASAKIVIDYQSDEAAKPATPGSVAKYGALLSCAGAFTGLARQVCEDAGIMDCAGDGAALTFCQLATSLDNALGIVNAAWEGWFGSTKKKFVDAVVAGIDVSNRLLERYCPPQQISGKAVAANATPPIGTPLTEVERQSLIADLEPLKAQLNEAMSNLGHLDTMARQTRSATDQANLSAQMMSTIIDATSDDVESGSLFIVAAGGTVIRGVIEPGTTQTLILPSASSYSVNLFSRVDTLVGSSAGFTATPGSSLDLNQVVLSDTAFNVSQLIDSDNDGLTDMAEAVMGTNVNIADTDDDGISDGAEIRQGTNPLSADGQGSGIALSVPTAEPAVDISASNNLVFVATGASGVEVFAATVGSPLRRLTSFDTPGTAAAVACDGSTALIADMQGGIGLVNVSTRNVATLRTPLNVPGLVQSVAVAGPLGFAGTSDGSVVLVDVPSGTIVETLKLPSALPIQDMSLVREYLYVLQQGKLSVVRFTNRPLTVAGSVNVSTVASTSGRRMRLFGEPNLVRIVDSQGIIVCNVQTNPTAPAVIATFRPGALGWKQMVMNGSGLGIAAVGLNADDTGAHDIDLYNLTTNGLGTTYNSIITTPGIANAVAIYNGLAYVADGKSGVQVVNYLAYDQNGLPPTIALSSSVDLTAGQAQEGGLLRLTAAVTDDVQVRNVEFQVDGQRVFTDGNYPFEYRFVVPKSTPTKTSIKVRAKATDTGGNSTLSTEYTLNLTSNPLAPVLVSAWPLNGAMLAELPQAYATFSDAMDLASLAGGGFTLTEAGADGVFDTGDDVAITGTHSGRENTPTIFFAPEPALTRGFYRMRIGAPAAGLAGNIIATPTIRTFRIYSLTDADGDGVPDDWEGLLGYNSADSDSNDNGILDGDEDFDSDGVANRWELKMGADPRLVDSSGDGLSDSVQDSDNDGLRDWQEAMNGTSAFLADTDGDGLDDATEIAEGLNPLVSNVSPLINANTSQVSFVNGIFLPLDLTAVPASSANVGFINAPFDPLPVLSIPLNSAPVGFINAPLDPLPLISITVQSAIVSFRNDP